VGSQAKTDWAALAAASFIVQGCFSPAIDADNCAIQCNPGCPDGFVCNPTGYCVRQDYAGTCSEDGNGRAGGGGGDNGGGDNGGGDNGGGDNGALLGCDGGSTILSAEPVQPVEACTGEELAVELAVSGGAPPYYWSLIDAPNGLRLSQSTTSNVYLQGSFTEPGVARVQVRVQSGEDCSGFSLPVTVHAAPQITASFADSCVGQSYDGQLTADSGNPASYEWSVSGLPAGLELVGDHVVGEAPEVAGQLELEVSLADRYCAAEPRKVAWNIKAPGQCPAIGPIRLPAPCAGIAYEEALIPSDGIGPDYTWLVVTDELPDGLDFDPATGVIHGTPTSTSNASGKLKVVLTDSVGQQAHRELDLSLRESCWFAYIAEDDVSSRLHLRDVFLNEDIVLPTAPMDAGERVVDFELSPNGEWVAFRAGAPDRLRLHLYAASIPRPLDAVPIELDCGEVAAPCGVLDYAWSPDSQSLAVVLSGATESQEYLSGIDVSSPTLPWPAVGQASWDGDLIPLDYHGELIWAADQHLAFTGLDPDRPEIDRDLVYLARAPLLPEPVTTLVVGTALSLRAVPLGLVSFDPRLLIITALNLSGDREDMLPHGDAWVAPSGSLVAKTRDNGQLRMFDLGDTSRQRELTERPCAVVVAWGSPLAGGQRERLVCSDGTVAAPTGENLSVVDYDTLGESFVARPIPLSGTYVPALLANTRRVISPSGDWLLIGSPSNGVAVVDISTTSPVIPAPQNEIQLSTPAEIEFAPSGRAVAVYDKTGLFTYPIPIAAGKRDLSDITGALRAEPPSDLFTCQEDALESPERWCGAERIPGHFKWSRDSQGLLFEDAAGTLWLGELGSSPPRASIQVASRIVACPAPCTARPYAFFP
jgi:hypothetical protein